MKKKRNSGKTWLGERERAIYFIMDDIFPSFCHKKGTFFSLTTTPPPPCLVLTIDNTFEGEKKKRKHEFIRPPPSGRGLYYSKNLKGGRSGGQNALSKRALGGGRGLFHG